MTGLPGGRPPSPALVEELLARAAAAGHCAMRRDVLLSALAALDVAAPGDVLAAAERAGTVLVDEPVDGPDGSSPGPPALVAPAALASAEDAVAEGVERLLLTAEARPGDDELTGAGVVVLGGCCAQARRPVQEKLLVAARAAGRGPAVVPARSLSEGGPGGDEGPGLVVVEEAQLLDVTTAAALLDGLPDGATLVLAGDPEALPGPGPGDVLVDLVASGVVREVRARCPAGAASTAPPRVASAHELAHAVRAGVLPPVDSPDRALVAVPARGDAECVHRAVQLVTVSVPRAFGLAPEQVAVLTPLRTGDAGADALAAALAAAGVSPPVQAVPEALGRCFEAVVAVLPASAAGVLSRPLVQALASAATRHLSVVSAAGEALPAAVAGVTRRRRTTRLPALVSPLRAR